MTERVLRQILDREPSVGGKTVKDAWEKHSRACGRSPKREVEPHGTPRYGEMKRAAYAVNLGGIAEDVFRPIRWARHLFCFV